MQNKQVRGELFRFDKFAGEWLHLRHGTSGTIHCRKGCSGCCSLAVHASFPEATAAAATLTLSQQEALAGYVERLTASLPELTDMKSYLRRHRQGIGPCPFLDDRGSCGIYAIRPLTCRALLSTRPSEWCSIDFATLDDWDRQAYESGLDRQIVAWPTHYVAATQEMAQRQEADLLARMQQALGWSLTGNFPLMVWLAHPERLGRRKLTGQQVNDRLTGLRINHSPVLALQTATGADPAHQL